MPKKKSKTKKATTAAAALVQEPLSKKTGIYTRTERSHHGKVFTKRARYGLSTELMQAILVTIMRRYYAVQRDIVLGATVENNANWSVAGAENAAVGKLEDRMAIHKSLYDGIALAEKNYGEGNTFIPLDVILGLRDPHAPNANQHVILAKLFGEALATDHNKRLAFFRARIAKDFPGVVALFETLLGRAQLLGLDLSFFGPGNKLAGITFVERPGSGTTDEIDAHISIEPSYYHQHDTGDKRVSGYHFTNHHAPTGGAGGSAQTLHQFYTNYGKPMSVETAIAEAARTNRPSPTAAPKTPPRGASSGRFELLTSRSGASEESPHASPYRGEIPPMALLEPNKPVKSFIFEIKHSLNDKYYIITWYENNRITYEPKYKEDGKTEVKELPIPIKNVTDTVYWQFYIKDMLVALKELVKTDPAVQKFIDDLEIINVMIKIELSLDDLRKLTADNNKIVRQIGELDAQLDVLEAQIKTNKEKFNDTSKIHKALNIVEKSLGNQFLYQTGIEKRKKMYEEHLQMKKRIKILNNVINAFELDVEKKKKEYVDKYIKKATPSAKLTDAGILSTMLRLLSAKKTNSEENASLNNNNISELLELLGPASNSQIPASGQEVPLLLESEPNLSVFGPPANSQIPASGQEVPLLLESEPNLSVFGPPANSQIPALGQEVPLLIGQQRLHPPNMNNNNESRGGRRLSRKLVRKSRFYTKRA